jgi:hypothetical protein
LSSAEGEERQGDGERKVSCRTFRLQGKKINFFTGFNINVGSISITGIAGANEVPSTG